MKKKSRKQTPKKRLLKILLIILSLATVYSFAAPRFLAPDSAYAAGDLTIDWGVTIGAPIFVVSNMLPGDIESREVDVTNDGIVPRTVAVRGVKTSEALNFSTVLDFVILDGATSIWGAGSATGPKTLEEFFTDSGDINGIALSTLAPSASTTYTFKATFDPASGNEFQNAEVVFDLIIGIFIEDGDIPAECSQITFSGDPIFGTGLGDAIDGTEGNDLIFGLEGSDAIDGLGGDDCIVGGVGGDYLVGGAGNDVILGSEENDTLVGGEGDDLLIGESGPDSLFGEAGEDKLIGNDGDDYLNGGAGQDILDAGGGNDTLFGESEDDFLDAGAGGGDFNSGGDGVDTCINAESTTECEL